ncbi:MAG TPA: type III pantothenate kinase [Gammaproteobacteria bacterium]|nr:type III pantothenate kinase [Gammaproteobacteria bacterium]
MKLLIDAGNTHISWATHPGRGGKLSERRDFKFNRRKAAEMFSKQWSDLGALKEIVVANVAGTEFSELLTQWSQNTFSLTPNFISAKKRAAGVSCGYLQPEHLGADRWAAIVGAWQRCHNALCVVDVGSALTIDVVDATGKHQGGLIAPGLKMMRNSLLSKTKNIKDNSAQGLTGQVPKLLARDTADAIELGSLYAIVALIDRVVADVRVELGMELHNFITGGEGATVLPLVHDSFQYQPDLVLNGLYILSRTRREK